MPSDWTGYTFVEFWCYSGVANDSEFVFNAYTENDATEGIDYFQRHFKVDWEGWKHIKIPTQGLRVSRQPTMEQIDRVSFSNTGWHMTPADDTMLVLDELVLTRGKPRELPPGVIEDFEGDMSLLTGLEIVEYDGRKCGKWSSGFGDKNLGGRPFEDWTGYDYLEMDIASEVANNDMFIIMAQSESPDTEGPDYWDCFVTVDWVGWRHFRIPLKRMHEMRLPLGWHMITGLNMFTDGWGMPEYPDTVLYFDDIKLTKGDGKPLMPEGVIDNFEFGTLSWRGTIKPETEHVGGGKCAARISMRTDTTSGDAYTSVLPKTDWSGKKLRMWTYASGIGDTQPINGQVSVVLTSASYEDGKRTGSGSRSYATTLRNEVESVIEIAIDGPGQEGGKFDPKAVSYLRIQFRVMGAEAKPEAFLCVDEIELVE